MFSKKLRHKIEFDVRVESVEQIPNTYVNSGGIKIAYAKGKQPSHKGETEVVPCTSQNVVIGQSLIWKTKLSKDEKTGIFDSKSVAFKLKHVAKDSNKESTLGTASVDLSQLCTMPVSTTKLDVQFAAKHQGKLKTKATLFVTAHWLKVGDKAYRHDPSITGTLTDEMVNGDGLNPSGEFFTAETLMTTPIFAEDGTASELSDSSSVIGEDDEANDDSNVLFESHDLDLSHSQSHSKINSQHRLSTHPSPVISNGSDTILAPHPLLAATTDPHESTSLESAQNGNSVHVAGETTNGSSTAQAQGTTRRDSMRRQSSHPEIHSTSAVDSTHVTIDHNLVRKSVGPGVASKSSKTSRDVKMHSASMSVLPEFNSIEASTLSLPDSGPGSTRTSRKRGKSTSVSRGGVAPSTSPSIMASASYSSIPTGAYPYSSSSSLGHMPPSHPQASIRPPVESSPYVSYVELDAPELPNSSQESLSFLAPNAFAIQSAATAGDEIAKLRAERVDKNLQIGLLGKQVSVLEQKLTDALANMEKAEKRESERLDEISRLEKMLKAAAAKQQQQSISGVSQTGSGSSSRLIDDSTTIDDGSESGSSGNVPAATKPKKKRKKSSRAALSSPSSSSRSARQVNQTRLCWTPEQERRGLMIFIATSMFIILLFYSSPFFRSALVYSAEQFGLQFSASGAHQPAQHSSTSPQSEIFSAATRFSEAFASALSMENSTTSAPVTSSDNGAANLL